MISDLIRDFDYTSPNQSTVSAEEQPQKERISEAESTRNIIEWLQGAEAGDNPPDLESASDIPDEIGVGSYLDARFIEESEAFLRAGLPWKWLTTKLSSWARLSWPSNKPDDDVSSMITAATQKSATHVKLIACQMTWDPVSFLRMHYDRDDPPRLGDVVTMTGWDNQVQSMTCAEYLQQTWPLYGVGILNAVQDAMQSPSGMTTRKSYGQTQSICSHYHSVTDTPHR